ncbi:MAG: hypothetical protein K2G01_06720 [Paramuribaculum sp.]|nr:hypothetical protein [Paramuribaculum sp.]MDE6323533.1 hypothetical protein [Paramuribaculum sp.]
MNTHEKISDEKLKALLNEQKFITAPPSPWFTKKVMNRLPPKRVRSVAIIEYAVYAVAAVMTAVLAAVYGIDCYRSGTITVGDLITLCIYFGLFVSIAWLGITPWIDDSKHVPGHAGH